MPDDIRDCHPIERCFFSCPKAECRIAWHKYNLTTDTPIPDEEEEAELFMGDEDA